MLLPREVIDARTVQRDQGSSATTAVSAVRDRAATGAAAARPLPSHSTLEQLHGGGQLLGRVGDGDRHGAGDHYLPPSRRSLFRARVRARRTTSRIRGWSWST